MHCDAQWPHAHAAAATTERTPIRRHGLCGFLISLVRWYQRHWSKYFRGNCLFQPSCSEYAVEALGRHGARRGSRLIVSRLWRCRPSAAGGSDPVP